MSNMHIIKINLRIKPMLKFYGVMKVMRYGMIKKHSPSIKKIIELLLQCQKNY